MKQDAIYFYMSNTTLAGIVAAARQMMDDCNPSTEVLQMAVDAGTQLAANVGREQAQAMIDAEMD